VNRRVVGLVEEDRPGQVILLLRRYLEHGGIHHEKALGEIGIDAITLGEGSFNCWDTGGKSRHGRAEGRKSGPFFAGSLQAGTGPQETLRETPPLAGQPDP
jgi:hypothetical protein